MKVHHRGKDVLMGCFGPCGRLFILSVTLTVMVQGCKPLIEADLLHPDADKQITFTATRGNVNGTITQMEIKVADSIVASAPGDSATHTGGPYYPFSNNKLYFQTIATKSGGTEVSSNKKWVYIANPRGCYTFTAPTGSDNGYPAATSEQTGANLYRLDKSIVSTHAMYAVQEYANNQGMTATEVLATSDTIVAAVAWYVDEHMSWRRDSFRFLPVNDLAFGDFNGDGTTDVFSHWGGKWHVSYGGGWQDLATSDISVGDLGFGDFGTSSIDPTPDDITDVFSHWGGRWHVSYGGVSAWQDLATSNVGVGDLGFGDFNGDGTTDVFSYWGGNWHVSYRGTSNWQDYGPVTNRVVFANNEYGDYSPGWDFPQPADLTLTISGNLTNAAPNDDFQGDCEDHAILRSALLRALGYCPWGIWDVIDNPVTHEYNVVLYEGAYRLMDYGTIVRWLATHTWSSHQSYYGWNEDNGPRGANSTTHAYLENNTNNYPGGKKCTDWDLNNYYEDTCP